ncbi:MAG: KTSC domain-containing protein [Cyanobacteria bacterium J06638_38]
MLKIEFKNDSIYQYIDVPKSVFEELKIASSASKYFNNHIRDKFSCDLIANQ